MENQQDTHVKCKICGKPAPKNYRSPMDYHRVCDDHIAYSTSFLWQFTQKRLGIIKDYPEDMKQCQFCLMPLTTHYMDTRLGHSTINICCKKHNEVKNWQQYDHARAWLFYAQENPSARLITLEGLFPKPPQEYFKWFEEMHEKNKTDEYWINRLKINQ